jgi:hypothetical protein
MKMCRGVRFYSIFIRITRYAVERERVLKGSFYECRSRLALKQLNCVSPPVQEGFGLVDGKMPGEV